MRETDNQHYSHHGQFCVRWEEEGGRKFGVGMGKDLLPHLSLSLPRYIPLPLSPISHVVTAAKWARSRSCSLSLSLCVSDWELLLLTRGWRNSSQRTKQKLVFSVYCANRTVKCWRRRISCWMWNKSYDVKRTPEDRKKERWKLDEVQRKMISVYCHMDLWSKRTRHGGDVIRSILY